MHFILGSDNQRWRSQDAIVPLRPVSCRCGCTPPDSSGTFIRSHLIFACVLHPNPWQLSQVRPSVHERSMFRRCVLLAQISHHPAMETSRCHCPPHVSLLLTPWMQASCHITCGSGAAAHEWRLLAVQRCRLEVIAVAVLQVSLLLRGGRDAARLHGLQLLVVVPAYAREGQPVASQVDARNLRACMCGWGSVISSHYENFQEQHMSIADLLDEPGSTQMLRHAWITGCRCMCGWGSVISSVNFFQVHM